MVLAFSLEPELSYKRDVAPDPREHGEGEHLQNLAGILVHFAKWCDANGLQLAEALKLAATL
jgi:hypothetical protein